MSEQPEMPEVVKQVVEQATEAAPDNVEAINQPKKLSKIDLKRQQIFMDRMKRKMGEKNKDGSLKTQEQALMEMQREDYDAMPLEKKFERFQSAASAALNNLANDIMVLRQNDSAIGDAFDVNYRALDKMFRKLGLSDEDRKAIMDETQAEVAADKAAALKAHQEAKEKAQIEDELRKAEEKTVTPAESEGDGLETKVAEGATVFGG